MFESDVNVFEKIFQTHVFRLEEDYLKIYKFTTAKNSLLYFSYEMLYTE